MGNKFKSDILKYKADLEIKVEPYTRYFDDTENFYYNENNNKTDGISNSLDTFILHRPSLTINAIDEAINFYSNTIESIKENVDHKNINDYLLADNENVIKDILEKNFDDIYGSTALEALVEIEGIHKFLSNLRDDYSFLVYGKDVDTNTSKEIDDSYIDFLVEKEKENDFCKVNYFMIYFDTEISILIRDLSNSLIRILIDLSSINDNLDESALQEKHLEVIKKGFFINNKKIEKDKAKEVGIYDNFINFNRKMFLEKEECNYYNETFGELYSLGDEIDLINDIKFETKQSLGEITADIFKISLYIEMCKEDICKKLLKKQKFRNFFKH